MGGKQTNHLPRQYHKCREINNQKLNALETASDEVNKLNHALLTSFVRHWQQKSFFKLGNLVFLFVCLSLLLTFHVAKKMSSTLWNCFTCDKKKTSSSYSVWPVHEDKLWVITLIIPRLNYPCVCVCYINCFVRKLWHCWATKSMW